VKKKWNQYQWNTLATPVMSWNSAPPTRGSKVSLSTALATPVTAGQTKNRGQTVHNLANRRGIDAMPVATWTPWVNW